MAWAIKETNRIGRRLAGLGAVVKSPSNPDKERTTSKQISRFLAAGTGLVGIALFTPDASHHWGMMFVKLARNSMWQHWFEWNAVWCSLKIIFFSLGVFFIVDSIGTLLVSMKHPRLGQAVFLMHLAPVFGWFAGVYLLLKSLF